MTTVPCSTDYRYDHDCRLSPSPPPTPPLSSPSLSVCRFLRSRSTTPPRRILFHARPLSGSPVVSRISVPGHRGGADSPAGRRSVRVDSPVGRHSVRSQAASVGPARGSPATVSLSRSGGHSDAIAAYSVRRWYGSGKTKNIVLKDLDMALPRGKIYGLLGPSGCGKYGNFDIVVSTVASCGVHLPRVPFAKGQPGSQSGISRPISAALCHPSRVVWHPLRSARADWMLIFACNLM